MRRQNRNHPTPRRCVGNHSSDWGLQRKEGNGSGAKIMYLDLYKGLRLKPKDLTPYSSPLMSFDGKIFMPKGQIRLPVQIGPEIVEVDFIMVDTYSPYTAIVARPWLYTLGVVASTLHHKVKFPSEGRVLEIRGC